MKLVMDERLKHRLIGLAVIISLGAIFLPAIMKKSSQKLENNMSVHVTLPAKPSLPDVVVTDEKDVFKTIKVARVQLPSVSTDKQISQLVQALPINVAKENNKTDELANKDIKIEKNPVKLALNPAVQKTVKKEIKVALKPSLKSIIPQASKKKVVAKVTPKVIATMASKGAHKTSSMAKTANIKKGIYALQIASFSQMANAMSLVNKLHSKGYKANFSRVKGKQSPIYKVYVGHSPRRDDVLKLQSHLASAMQLHGFIVNTGMS